MTAWAVQFPTEFRGLTAPQQAALERTLASHALEGLAPDREFVANLAALTAGEIDRAEYRRRGRAWSQKRRQRPAARAAG
ncbi:hypothetical protein [Nocardia asteroides]|uniref:antitoxin VbhA family protein n=1 Tax=Nocardia asteroides TaxID=1824 RepID=UPI001E4DB29C|nr:hypothetical protein [Nocardia asteroides]UGT58860.1 hypothetical protein LTT85_33450 [Nocardia asteroides]